MKFPRIQAIKTLIFNELFVKITLIQENFESLMGNICFFCDDHYDSNLKSCNLCGAGDDDMMDYAIIHNQTLRRRKNSKLEKGSIYNETLFTCNKCNLIHGEHKTLCNDSSKSALAFTSVLQKHLQMDSTTEPNTIAQCKELQVDGIPTDCSITPIITFTHLANEKKPGYNSKTQLVDAFEKEKNPFNVNIPEVKIRNSEFKRPYGQQLKTKNDRKISERRSTEVLNCEHNINDRSKQCNNRKCILTQKSLD